jgi:hypothetical protein
MGGLIQVRIIRVVTALGIIGLCGWPLWQGYNVIRYTMAGSPEALRPWFSVSGIAFDAREDAVTHVDVSSNSTTIRRRREELGDMLAIRPMSARYWLQLAEARVDLHETLAKTIDTLELSAITGPNEDYMLMQRGLFGIWQWEVLPPDHQQRAAADLVSATGISDGKAAWLREALSEKAEQFRQQIRSALQARGFPKRDLDRIGL